LYVDTHAGRGKYETGEAGAPLVALTTLLTHDHRDKMLAASKFDFLFIERDPENMSVLQRSTTCSVLISGEANRRSNGG
jgi:hypothetical protein